MSDTPPSIVPVFAAERVPETAGTCLECGFGPVDLEPRCPTCDAQRTPPNVTLSSRLEEQEAVVRRVETVLRARTRESALSLLSFGEAIRGSVAVVNVSVRYAIDFLESESLLFATYAKLVQSGARRPAAGVDDSRRRSVESILFGTYGEDMRYAALSLNGGGLVSYGPVTMVLRDIAIRHRASLLEENSFDFVERHQLRPGQSVPVGFRCPWPTRHQLAMAKLADRISDRTADTYQSLLLSSVVKGRSSDQFVEVFVFGPFGKGAVERLVLPSAIPKGVYRSELRILRRKASLRGIQVEDQ